MKLKWTIKEAYQVLLTFFLIQFTILMLEEVHSQTGLFNIFIPEAKTLKAVLLYIITALTFIFPLWFHLIRGKKIKLSHFGLVPTSILKTITMVLMGYGYIFTSVIIMGIISYYLYPVDQIPGFGVQESILPYFGEGRAALIAAAVIAVGIAPFVEELFFRGFLLQTLMSKLPFTQASIITAFLFAFLHFQFANIWPIFILSLIINYIYYKSENSIIPTIAFHMVNNAVALTIISNIDKISEYTAV